jgi:hypothetical protein
VSTSYWNRYVHNASVAALQNMPGLMDEQAMLVALATLGLSATPDPDAA